MFGQLLMTQLLKAARIVVIISEINNKKPMDTIRPNENRRVRISVKMALCGFTFTSQIIFNTFCNSTNTHVAPTSTTTNPIIVASNDLWILLMLIIISLTCLAVSTPIIEAICV